MVVTNYLDMFDDLPNSLRTEIMLYINREIVEKVPFFANCDQVFIGVVVTCLKSQVCPPGEFIIKQGNRNFIEISLKFLAIIHCQGDFGREMFFLSRGSVEILIEDKETKMPIAVKTLSDGAYFGEYALLYHERRSASVRALTYCDLYILTKDDFNR